MSWDNLDPVLVYMMIGAIVFFTAVGLFAKGGVDDDKTNNNHHNSH